MKKNDIIMIAIVLLSAMASAWAYSVLPEKIATHWDVNGVPNGYMDKFSGLAIMPVISAFLLALFKAIPSMDPRGDNIKKFGSHYENFIVVMLGFLLYIHIVTIAWNLGYSFEFSAALIPAFSILFYCIGILMKHAKPNWFIGIRTPWTISSDKVWDKTHALGAGMFKAIAVLTMFCIVLPGKYLMLPIGLLVAGSLFLVVYSYFEYQKEKKEGTGNDTSGRKIQVRKVQQHR